MQSKTYKTVGTADAFVEDNFNSWKDANGWNDGLEVAWRQGVEDVALPLVRALLSGADGQEHRDAARALAALHLARSYSYEAIHHHILSLVGAQEIEKVENSQEMLQLYASSKGHQPARGEIGEYIDAMVEDIRAGRRFMVEGMVRLFHFTLKLFEEHDVQLLYVPANDSVSHRRRPGSHDGR